MNKSIHLEYNGEEGLWHVVLVLPNGHEADVGTHCTKAEADYAKVSIEEWAETKDLEVIKKK